MMRPTNPHPHALSVPAQEGTGLVKRPDAPPLLLDSTLREGEQTPGVSFTIDEKLTIAHLLDAFGVDIIEAGHPAVSSDVRAGTRAVATAGLEAETLAHARCLREDIDLAIGTGAEWVGLFFSVRDAALEQRFRADEARATEIVVDAVQYAADHGLKIRYTPEDTVRSDVDRVIRIANAAVEAGAHRISVADTTGAMSPTAMGRFVAHLREHVRAPLNVHCHNDLGLATANALAAWESGATLVDTTVNGIGERCGITDTASFTTAVETLYGHTHWDLTLLPRIAETVAAATNIPVHWQAPVVGRHAFSHNAGLHVAAVLVDPSHYENISAVRVGRDRTLVLDRFAGLATVEARLRRLGIEPDPYTAREVLERIKQMEAAGLDDAELLLFYAESSGQDPSDVFRRHQHAIDPRFDGLAVPFEQGPAHIERLGIRRSVPVRATTETSVPGRRTNTGVLDDDEPLEPAAHTTTAEDGDAGPDDGATVPTVMARQS